MKKEQEERLRVEEMWVGQGRVEELRVEQENLLKQITTVYGQIDEARMSMESSKRQSKVLTSLMAQSSIKGVCGRLGDLGFHLDFLFQIIIGIIIFNYGRSPNLSRDLNPIFEFPNPPKMLPIRGRIAVRTSCKPKPF